MKNPFLSEIPAVFRVSHRDHRGKLPQSTQRKNFFSGTIFLCPLCKTLCSLWERKKLQFFGFPTEITEKNAHRGHRERISFQTQSLCVLCAKLCVLCGKEKDGNFPGFPQRSQRKTPTEDTEKEFLFRHNLSVSSVQNSVFSVGNPCIIPVSRSRVSRGNAAQRLCAGTG